MSTEHAEAREAWIAQCANRYIELACIESELAREYAEACAEMEERTYGCNPAEWWSPADAADSDMSYWGD